MKFLKGQKYRHRNSSDLDILVVSVYHTSEEETKLKIKYINKRSGRIQYAGRGYNGETETVRIRNKDYENWKRVPIDDLVPYSYRLRKKITD